MSNYLMLDLETLDIKSSSIVLSIGACVFNDTNLNTEKDLRLLSFYDEPNLFEQEKSNRTISLSTLSWWLKQPFPGLNKYLETEKFKNPIGHVLNNLNYFIISNKVEGIWSNGPTFDMNILTSLYESFNIHFPIDFRNWYDFRTIKLVRNILNLKNNITIGTKHNSLDDSITQALIVNETLFTLKGLIKNIEELKSHIKPKKKIEIDDSEYIGPRIEDMDLIIDMND